MSDTALTPKAQLLELIQAMPDDAPLQALFDGLDECVRRAIDAGDDDETLLDWFAMPLLGGQKWPGEWRALRDEVIRFLTKVDADTPLREVAGALVTVCKIRLGHEDLAAGRTLPLDEAFRRLGVEKASHRNVGSGAR